MFMAGSQPLLEKQEGEVAGMEGNDCIRNLACLTEAAQARSASELAV